MHESESENENEMKDEKEKENDLPCKLITKQPKPKVQQKLRFGLRSEPLLPKEGRHRLHPRPITTTTNEGFLHVFPASNIQCFEFQTKRVNEQPSEIMSERASLGASG
jgi:hypothetical protein